MEQTINILNFQLLFECSFSQHYLNTMTDEFSSLNSNSRKQELWRGMRQGRMWRKKWILVKLFLAEKEKKVCSQRKVSNKLSAYLIKEVELYGSALLVRWHHTMQRDAFK